MCSPRSARHYQCEPALPCGRCSGLEPGRRRPPRRLSAGLRSSLGNDLRAGLGCRPEGRPVCRPACRAGCRSACQLILPASFWGGSRRRTARSYRWRARRRRGGSRRILAGQAEQGAVEHGGDGVVEIRSSGTPSRLADEQGERLLEAVDRVEVDALDDLLVRSPGRARRTPAPGESGAVEFAGHDAAPWEWTGVGVIAASRACLMRASRSCCWMAGCSSRCASTLSRPWPMRSPS